MKDSSLATFIEEESSVFTEIKSVNLLTTDLSFDLSIHAVFNTLCNGGTLVITDLELIYRQDYIEKLINHNNVTHVLATPSFLSLIDYTKIQSITKFAAVGEVLPNYLAKKILKNGFSIYNVYGPTETTCYVTEIEIKNENVNKIPVGISTKNSGVCIVDEFDNPVCEGYQGEIIIFGPCVFDGYVNGDKSEFTLLNGVRCYKTGDIGYFEDGVLYFSHRKDNQIKISGYRIELGKIEEVISTILHGEIFHIDIIDDSIVLFHTSEINTSDLIKYAQAQLPEYMVPRRVVKLKKMPLTKNYKIDKRKLKSIDRKRRELSTLPHVETEGSEKISQILLDLGVDLNYAREFKVKKCGLSSMSVFSLQKKLSKEDIYIDIKQLLNLKIKELILLKKGNFNKQRNFDYSFPDHYKPSNIQEKFIINNLKNKQSTLDNIGCIARFDNYYKAKKFCDFCRNRILNDKNFYYYVSIESGKLCMKFNPNFTLKENEIDIRTNQNLRDYITHFDLYKGPLCSIKILKNWDEYLVLLEVHHLIVDGFSLKKIASKEDYNPVPYHNYRQIIESNCETEHLKNDVKESFDLSEYRRNEFISSGVLDIDINVIRKISRELNVSHESIFATAYISAMNLERAVVCTPTNLRKLPEDYCVTGPLINLIGFKVLIQNYDKKTVS